MQITFIGAGKMATAIVRGVLSAQVHTPKEISAVDPSAEARSTFSGQTGVAARDYDDVRIDKADVIVLAMKPQQMGEAAARLPAIREDQLVVSIAAGVSLSRLAEYVQTHRIVRVMPNTPMGIGRGSIAFSADSDVTEDDKAWVRKVFGPVGLVREVPESMMDAVTAVSGSGPAYVFEFIRALGEAGADQGLPRELSDELAVQTVLGAAQMVKQGEGTPEQLRNNVTSKGGTTAEGLSVLAEHDLEGLLKKTVHAAKTRSEELGRQS